MKKIMFILAFVSVGLFATASNGNVGKIKLAFKKEVKVNSVKNNNVWEYSVTVTCNGQVHYSCCYPTYAAAHAQGQWLIVGNCTPYNH